MPRKIRKPAYTLHKATGQARVRIHGKDHYLGPFGSAESREQYDELIADWLFRQDTSAVTLSIDDLCLLYMEHVLQHYRKDGEPTSEVSCQRIALRWLIKKHGRTRVRDFSPKCLKEVRQAMIEAGYVRTSINAHVGRIRRMFRWGVEEEHVPVTVYQALMAVAGLRVGRSQAREADPVGPVSEQDVAATLRYLPEIVADMVRLQLLTGCRPGEICGIRPCDVSQESDNGTWCYRPARHKTQHHGQERRIYIGPRGQELLCKYLDRDPDACCFSPAESESQRNNVRRQNRRSPLTPSQRARESRGRSFKDHYTKDSYNRCVARACKKANIDAWSPNQLRHARATMLRAEFGIEAAQVVLGHSNPETTLIYAETRFGKAAEIAREIG